MLFTWFQHVTVFGSNGMDVPDFGFLPFCLFPGKHGKPTREFMITHRILPWCPMEACGEPVWDPADSREYPRDPMASRVISFSCNIPRCPTGTKIIPVKSIRYIPENFVWYSTGIPAGFPTATQGTPRFGFLSMVNTHAFRTY